MKLSIWVVLLGAMTFICPLAGADDPIGRFSLGGSGGYSGYALDTINDRIVGSGNEFLDDQGWSTVDRLTYGWSFWADLRIPLPLGEFSLPLPFGASLPMEFSVGGGLGISSGSTGGKDYNELININLSQSAYHARLFYTLPFRPQEDTRLFLAGGPLIITKQEVLAEHTHRSSAGGGSGTEATERKEEVVYSGDGQGWQLGLVTEYMIQDRITLCLDIAYRWAKVDYTSWVSTSEVSISDTDPVDLGDGTTTLERLRREESYVFRGFLDWEETEAIERATLGGEVDPYGPHLLQLQPLAPDNLDIDLTGLQAHFGFRIYFL